MHNHYLLISIPILLASARDDRHLEMSMLLFASGHEEHGSGPRNGGKRSGCTGPLQTISMYFLWLKCETKCSNILQWIVFILHNQRRGRR